MSQRCPVCDHQSGSGTVCPRCGAPLGRVDPPGSGVHPFPGHPTPPPPPTFEPQQPVAAPRAAAAPAAAPVPAGSATPATAARRTALIVAASVLALVLLAGGALAAVSAVTAAGRWPQLPFGPAQLTVTGQPPSTAGSWASGTQELWRTRGVHRSGTLGETRDFFNGTSTLTTKAWALTDLVGDVTFDVWAFDPSTGTITWDHPGNLECAADELGGLVPCIDSVPVRGSEEYQDVLVMVDWETGQAKSTKPLQEFGIRVSSAAPDVAVVGDAIVLTLPDYPDAGPELGRLAGVTTAKISAAGSRALWVSTSQGCDGCEQGASRVSRPASNLQHGVLTTRYGSAYDFATGKSLFDDSVYVIPMADGALHASNRDASAAASALVAPDGTKLALVEGGGGWTFVDRLPPLPLSLTIENQVSEESGLAALTAVDPATGLAAWSSPLKFVVRTMPLAAGEISYDGQRLIVKTSDTLTALDPTTGAVLWSRALDGTTYWSLDRTSDGTILAGSYLQSAAFNPETGAMLWEVEGELTVAPGSDGQESLLNVGGYGENRQPYVARLLPADRLTKSPEVPADAPACPSGMTPLSWTQYADGAILLCRQGDRYQVVSPGHADWQATELNFTEGGYQVVFGQGTTVRVALGGSIVYVEADGAITTHAATRSWNNAGGDASYPVPSGLKSCPAGSWPISLSTFQGGWLLVCGTSTTQPTSLVFADGTDASEGTSVTYQNGAYCGETARGRVCGYRAPAVVSVESPNGTTQHSATSNYFSGYGQGGAGEGTGSYGVDTPEATAKDQVRYLTQILQKSMAGRSNIDRAVDQVRTCTAVSEAIATMNSVTANREELLAALDSTPVDAVPDGSSLVAKLRHALQLSHDSDQVWVSWATSEQSNGCSEGEDNAYYQQVTVMNLTVAQAKSDFLNDWNSQIAPAYGAPTFTTSQI